MTFDPNDPRWTAYVLDELSSEEKREVEQLLAESLQAQQLVEEIRLASEWLGEELQNEPSPALTEDRRRRILGSASRSTWVSGKMPAFLAAAAMVVLTVGVSLFYISINGWPFQPDQSAVLLESDLRTESAEPKAQQAGVPGPSRGDEQPPQALPQTLPPASQKAAQDPASGKAVQASKALPATSPSQGRVSPLPNDTASDAPSPVDTRRAAAPAPPATGLSVSGTVRDRSGAVIPGVEVRAADMKTGEQKTTLTNDSGSYSLPGMQSGKWKFRAELMGFRTFDQEIELTDQDYRLDAVLEVGDISESIIVVSAGEVPVHSAFAPPPPASESALRKQVADLPLNGRDALELARLRTGRIVAPTKRESDALRDETRPVRQAERFNTESYDPIQDNPFLRVTDNALSTFSIDVDTASYANLRRFLNQGQRPPKDAVRIEEMINYFQYDYAPPTGEQPFSVHLDVASAPWNPRHRLLRVGLKGKEVSADERPAANLVFLIDVSGSMRSANKLPLLKQGMKLLVDELADKDRVAIAVYAGAAGLVLPSTPCTEKHLILEALDRLRSGGSTAGAAGIRLAYQTAQQNFIPGGINRVVLATDGDFNVGVSSNGELVELIEGKRQSGVFLSVLGFGMGNYKDSKLELLADKGNGNYAYIDSLREARKVLVEEMGGTLMTIAKDVKIQIEFNPRHVGAYRLIGYENRLLAAQDFNDDSKDAGEIGAGHTVTALYELIPPGLEGEIPTTDPLKYQAQIKETADALGGETATVKLRYKQPDEDDSRLIEIPLRDSGLGWQDSSRDFMFAAGVAAFGMILRDSPHKGSAGLDTVVELAESGMGRDPSGRRAEFLSLVKSSRGLLR